MVESAGRSKDADDIEQRILAAATELIVHYGYAKTTMNDISRESGVAKSTIYTRWKTKDDLLMALIARETLWYIERWLEYTEADPQGGTIAGLYRNAFRTLYECPLLMALYRQDRQILGSALINRFMNRPPATLRVELLRHMQSAGVVRQDIDIEAMVYVLNMMSYGFLKIDEIIPAEEAPPFERVLDQIAVLIDRVLSPDDGGNSEAGKQIIRQFASILREQIASLETRGGKQS